VWRLLLLEWYHEGSRAEWQGVGEGKGSKRLERGEKGKGVWDGNMNMNTLLDALCVVYMR